MTVNGLFSAVMMVFGLYVISVANASLYAPNEVVGFLVTIGMICTVTGIFSTLNHIKR